MFMKIIKTGSVLGCVLFLTTVANAGVSICYQEECHPMVTYNQQQVMAQLKEIFINDKHALLFCESDSKDRKCSGDPISFAGHSRVMEIDFQIPFARVSQIKQKDNSIEMVLDYQVKANQFYPLCVAPQSSLNLIDSWGGALQLVSPSFKCRLTDLGTTQMELKFDVDYINLDRGVFGGTYRVNVYGDVVAEKSGYVLFQLTNERVVEMPRPVLGKAPSEELTVKSNMETDVAIDDMKLNVEEEISTPVQENPPAESTPTNWGAKWDSFKKRFLKILYLEPLDD